MSKFKLPNTTRNFFLIIVTVIFVTGYRCTKNTTPAPDDPGNGSTEIQHRVLIENLNYPWEILWGPDNFIWMTERGGRISRVNPATGAVTPVFTIAEVQSNGEGGLLGMALHPAFSANPFVYVAYNYNSSNGYKEKIVRFTYNGNTLNNAKTLLENIDAASIHNGCRLLIWNDKLFITTGDAANQPSAQNTSSLNGKVLRINLDGSIPSDNPIAGNPLWSLGHRNAQGLVVAGNTLFSSEHGPDTDDEINIIEKGKNFGWPNVKGSCDNGGEQSFCAANNVKEPIKTWTPTAAICGMDFYNNDHIRQWKNSLLVTALKNSRLYQLKLNTDRAAITEANEFFTNTYGRLRDVCVAPDGKVYICTSNGNDKIIVVEAHP
ncbi:MAG: sorbosone dehydrogenase family protein [Chitinophagaceae bacterium]